MATLKELLTGKSKDRLEDWEKKNPINTIIEQPKFVEYHLEPAVSFIDKLISDTFSNIININDITKIESVSHINEDTLTPEQLEKHRDTMVHLNDILFNSIREQILDVLPTIPIVLRLNFCLNSTNNTKDEDIDWDKINHLIFDNPIKDDFNCNLPSRFSSRDQMYQIKSIIEDVSIINGPWLDRNCKDCKEKFTMDKSEVDFFLNKDLSLPKRCPSCRKIRKAGK